MMKPIEIPEWEALKLQCTRFKKDLMYFAFFSETKMSSF